MWVEIPTQLRQPKILNYKAIDILNIHKSGIILLQKAAWRMKIQDILRFKLSC